MLRLEERPVLVDLVQAEALHALHDQAQRAVGELEHLVDVGERADPEEVALDGVVHGGIALGDHADDLALAHRVVDEGHRALARHRQGQDGVGEQDGVPQRQDGQLGRAPRRGSPRCTPPDSKSGVRSSLSLIRLLLARACPRQRSGGEARCSREPLRPRASRRSRRPLRAPGSRGTAPRRAAALSRASAISSPHSAQLAVGARLQPADRLVDLARGSPPSSA